MATGASPDRGHGTNCCPTIKAEGIRPLFYAQELKCVQVLKQKVKCRGLGLQIRENYPKITCLNEKSNVGSGQGVGTGKGKRVVLQKLLEEQGAAKMRFSVRGQGSGSQTLSTIGMQQLDFLGNCQCRLSFLDNMHKESRAQVPILDTTQMGCLSIVGTWTLLPFSGAI